MSRSHQIQKDGNNYPLKGKGCLACLKERRGCYANQRTGGLGHTESPGVGNSPDTEDLDSHPVCRQTWCVNFGHSARWSVWESGRFSNTIAQAEMYAPHEADMTAKGSSE